MLNWANFFTNVTSLKACLAFSFLALAACGGGGGGSDSGDNSASPQQSSRDCTGADRNNDGLVDACNKTGSTAMNLNTITYWSTEYPFIDLMKQSGGWEDEEFTTNNEDFALDENDWLLSLEDGEVAHTIFLRIDDASTFPFDKVIVLYEGEGTLEYDWAASKIEDESSTGRDVVQITNGAHLLRITETNANDPLRNIRIIPDIFMDAYETGEIFNPVFIERIGQFRALRFMDWMLTNNSEQEDWADRPLIADRSWALKGVPLEIMLQLVNKVQADPWFTIPHRANDNYVNQFASAVANQLDDSLKVYIEHSNEVWNFTFTQANYAVTSATERWGDTNPERFMHWHGMRTAQLCDTFKNNYFSNDPSQVKCVLGAHAAWQGLQEPAMQCSLWVDEGNQPCYQHGFDYIAITSYFSSGLNGAYADSTSDIDETHNDTLRSWFSEDDGGLNLAFSQLNDGSELNSINTEFLSQHTGAINQIRSQLEYWVDYANTYELGIVAYEGGSHITANSYPHQADEDFINFHVAINRDERMGALYTELMNAWRDAGAGLHVFFNDVSLHSQHGSWGALDNIYQETSHKWEAITTFNNTTECWWDDCD